MFCFVPAFFSKNWIDISCSIQKRYVDFTRSIHSDFCFFFCFSIRAGPGTYVFEPPGETHTLLVDDDCDEMVTLFHVTGSLLYVDDNDEIIGFDDVFSKLDKAKKWYAECGLGENYVEQFVR